MKNNLNDNNSFKKPKKRESSIHLSNDAIRYIKFPGKDASSTIGRHWRSRAKLGS
jgi:hypothetical protein